MNLLIPIGSQSKFFNIEEYGYPKPLIEILSKPMIQYVVENVTSDINFERIIYVVQEEDCLKYHLDETLKLLSPIDSVIIKIAAPTSGALCSALLAVDYINNTSPLIISNADQIFLGGVAKYINSFLDRGASAGCVTFESTHPRWSYVNCDSSGNVREATEKRPISRNAIAGLYMYKEGLQFVLKGLNSIRNGAAVEGNFYLAPVFNEFIIDGEDVIRIGCKSSDYFTFYSPHMIKEFELSLKSLNNLC